jgi:hypothetical protein
VRARIVGAQVEITVGPRTIKAQLPEFVRAAKGDAGFGPGDASELEVKNLRVTPAPK